MIAKTINNFKPDLLIIGHADRIDKNMLSDVKNTNKNLRVSQWFLDPLSRRGPDYHKNKERIPSTT